jgi:hypothetical protein
MSMELYHGLFIIKLAYVPWDYFTHRVFPLFLTDFDKSTVAAALKKSQFSTF